MIGNYKVVAVCTARVHDTSCYDFVTRLNEGLKDDNYRLFIYNLCNDYIEADEKNVEAAVFDLIDYKKTDVIVLMDEKLRNKDNAAVILAKAKENNVPVVVINGEYEGCVNLKFDYSQGFENVCRHVIEAHGKKKVHFIGGMPNNSFSEERKNVFKKVVEENGITFDESMTSYGYFESEHTARATEEIIKSGNIPEAIICANDVMAIKATAVLLKNGIKVPEQVLVTGFDGIEEIKFVTPKITSCFCNYDVMADETAEAVKKCFSKEVVENEIMVEPELILSESCGCEEKGSKSDDSSISKMSNNFITAQDDNRILFGVVEELQNSPSIQAAVEVLDKQDYPGISVIINKTVVDDSVLLLTVNIPEKYEDDMVLLYDTDANKPFTATDFKREDVIPNLDKHLETGYPLIFNELDFMGVTLGYTCFYFADYSMVKYAKISLIVTALRNAIGGFANVQYQHFITKEMGELHKVDSQTGLYNRSGFNMEYRALASKVQRDSNTLNAIYVSFDNYNEINHSFSFAAGDDAVSSIADALMDACPDEAFGVRLGGHEMIAVVDGELDLESIKSEVQRNVDKYNAEIAEYDAKITVKAIKKSATDDIEIETIVKEAINE
ncbi:MAG: substrate-binding domain-containing protein [Lachnospiraceae bacterium]|nr:substrate-binding domain-containing protein [Lachnospiraceae bacterium]